MTNGLEKEVVGKCKICGKEIRFEDLTAFPDKKKDKAVYHASFGVACVSHHGVTELYMKLLEEAGKE